MGLTPPDPRMGVVLQGRYKILERVASGAMGVVYRGERVSLGRTVAVKFLHPWIASQQAFRTRFETEARAMSRLSHPNCVSVIDFGVEGSSPYVVMEFIIGVTLRERLARGPIAPSRSVAIARQILAGVAHAHSQQIIHRDLKPENLILSETEGLGEHVRILDFGLAKLRDGPAMTSGLALGTPSYMSPEQTGASGEIDGRTDIYSMGILLFEMLAGRKPFVSDKVAEVLLMHRDASPPSLRQLVPELRLSGALEAVVNRALAKAPEDRFQTAADFARALEQVPEATSPAVPGGTFSPAVDAPIQVGPSLSNPVDATLVEARPSEVGATKAPTSVSAATSRSQIGPRVWIGFAGLLCLALALVAVGLRGAPAPGARAPAGMAAAPTGRVPAAGSSVAGPSPGVEHPIPAKVDPSVLHTATLPAAARKNGQAFPSPDGVVPPVALDERLGAANELIKAGEWEQATVVLEKARKENPLDARAAYELANLALEHRRWGEGAEAARAAAARDPKVGSDARLTRNLIRSLESDSGYRKSETVLRAFGSPAVPQLRQAAAHDSNPAVRQRARDILEGAGGGGIGRPRGPPTVRRSKPAPATRPLFSR